MRGWWNAQADPRNHSGGRQRWPGAPSVTRACVAVASQTSPTSRPSSWRSTTSCCGQPRGYVRRGSLASYLASCRPAELALVRAEATNWATQLSEATNGLSQPWAIAASDAYYDVERARNHPARSSRRRERRRSDPCRHQGLAPERRGRPLAPGCARISLSTPSRTRWDSRPRRVIGLWPEAGVALSVDGSMENLRCGARDLVRTAVAWRREQLKRAA